MGRWREAWFALTRAYTEDRISQAQFRAITDRHLSLPANEETLQLLLSSTKAAIEEYATTKAAEPDAGTQAPREPASGPTSLEPA